MKVYGALLCCKYNLALIKLRLVYYDITKVHETLIVDQCNAEALIDFLESLCQRYRTWHTQEYLHRKKRDDILMHLAFQFPEFRPN